MTRTTGATDAPPTGPAWEPKIIGARELWAIRESFKFCDTTQISDAVLDTMVNIMDGTPTRTNGFQSHGIRIKDHRIVRVDDLRAMLELAQTSKFAIGNYSLIDRIQAAIGEAES